MTVPLLAQTKAKLWVSPWHSTFRFEWAFFRGRLPSLYPLSCISGYKNFLVIEYLSENANDLSLLVWLMITPFCYTILFYPAEFEIRAFQPTDGSGFPVGSRGRVKCLLWHAWQKCVRRMTRHTNHNSPCFQPTLISSGEWPCVDFLPKYIFVGQDHKRAER